MIPFAEVKAEMMRDPAVRAAYDALADEFAIAEALIRARTDAAMTQADVAAKMQTSQSYIAKLESGRVSPSIRALQRYAEATGTALRITLAPNPAR